MRIHIYTCVYMAASCTRANFTRKCASYIHITESEPNLANRSPFAGETGTRRRNNRGSAEPSESKVDRVRGRVGYCAHANCITYFMLPRNRSTLNRLQEAAREGASLRSRSTGGLGRLRAGPSYWSPALIGKNGSSDSTGQSDSSNRSRGSRGPTLAICHWVDLRRLRPIRRR
jgi:hypothetical protein